MNQRNRNILMWALFALLYLLVMLVQTTLFGRLRIFGVKLNLMPVVLVCIAMQVNHEAAGLFGLIAGFVWYACGADDAALALVSYTILAILGAWISDNFLAKRFLSAMLLCLVAVLLHEGARFVLKYYLKDAPGRLLIWVPVITGLSIIPSPVIYLLAKSIRKVGIDS